MTNKLIRLIVWGDFACFTRPELKVERVSYPIMTPSAARGILEAVYWEPQFHYLVREISSVKHRTNDGFDYGKGNWFSFRRNELQAVTSMSTAKSAMKGMQAPSKLYIHAGGGAEDATQRNTLALQRVAYLITAEIHLSKIADPARCNFQKYYDRFRSRAEKGKCFYRPCLGCREFAADFEWCENPNTLDYVPWEEDLGIMLYDVFDPAMRNQGFAWLKDEELPSSKKKRKQRPFNGKLVKPQPVFFRAKIESGKMNCHPDEVELLRSAA
ncbi:MAG: type I-C CRISPR-associated protein Cas5 [Candidatus Omnitrophica bacterium]|nr:type I-C CRISPR-associated protein Cas5 [Candidatus Omnitrophota bacterium]